MASAKTLTTLVSISMVPSRALRSDQGHSTFSVEFAADEGDAREIWYEFRASTGAHPLPNQGEMALIIETETLEGAFRDGSNRFLSDLKAEQGRYEKAIERAKQLLVWGIGSIVSDEQIEQYLAHRA